MSAVAHALLQPRIQPRVCQRQWKQGKPGHVKHQASLSVSRFFIAEQAYVCVCHRSPRCLSPHSETRLQSLPSTQSHPRQPALHWWRIIATLNSGQSNSGHEWFLLYTVILGSSLEAFFIPQPGEDIMFFGLSICPSLCIRLTSSHWLDCVVLLCCWIEVVCKVFNF